MTQTVTSFEPTPGLMPAMNIARSSLPDLETFLELAGPEVYLGTEYVMTNAGNILAIRYQGRSHRTDRLLRHYAPIANPGFRMAEEETQKRLKSEKQRLEDDYGRIVQIDFF